MAFEGYSTSNFAEDFMTFIVVQDKEQIKQICHNLHIIFSSRQRILLLFFNKHQILPIILALKKSSLTSKFHVPSTLNKKLNLSTIVYLELGVKRKQATFIDHLSNLNGFLSHVVSLHWQTLPQIRYSIVPLVTTDESSFKFILHGAF